MRACLRDGNEVSRFRVAETRLRVDAGRELGLWGEARVGVFHGAGVARPKIGPPTLSRNEFDSGGVSAALRIDTLDNAQIPLSGTAAAVAWEGSRNSLGADADFDSYFATILHSWTRGRHTFNAGIDFGTTDGADNLPRNFFELGGFLRMSALSPGELAGPHMGLARHYLLSSDRRNSREF